MKKIFFILLGIFFLFTLTFSSCKSKDDPLHPMYSHHEDSSKARYEEMQTDMTEYAKDTNDTRLKLLSNKLEVQLKIEDYMIRYRQAEHAKNILFIPIFISSLSALLSILTFIYTISSNRKKKKRKEADEMYQI